MLSPLPERVASRQKGHRPRCLLGSYSHASFCLPGLCFSYVHTYIVVKLVAKSSLIPTLIKPPVGLLVVFVVIHGKISSCVGVTWLAGLLQFDDDDCCPTSRMAFFLFFFYPLINGNDLSSKSDTGDTEYKQYS
jgi:hypothetical protein